MEAQEERVFSGSSLFCASYPGRAVLSEVAPALPKSFEDLRAVGSVIHPTLKATCGALGLLEDDRQWEICLRDTAVSQTGHQLSHLFVKIVAFSNPQILLGFWNTIRDALFDDLRSRDHDATSLQQRESFATVHVCLCLKKEINIMVIFNQYDFFSLHFTFAPHRRERSRRYLL